MTTMFGRAAASGVLLVAVAACSGGHASAPLPVAATQSATHTGATLRVTIPPSASSKTASHTRRPQYVSPSTALLTITDGGVQIAQFGLGPSDPTCAAGTNGGVVCTEFVELTPGTHSLGVTLGDGSGIALSTTMVGVTITAASANVIPLTLGAVVASATIVTTDPNLLTDPADGNYYLNGTSAEPFDVDLLDADGNIIIDLGNPGGAQPGAPGTAALALPAACPLTLGAGTQNAVFMATNATDATFTPCQLTATVQNGSATGGPVTVNVTPGIGGGLAPGLNPILLSSTALTFSSGSNSAQQTLSVAEAGYNGGFFESDTCAPPNAPVIASVNATSASSFVVAAQNQGTCAITRDSFGQSANASVTVTGTSP